MYFFGPNFNMLGVAEIPFDVVRAKLRASNTSDLSVVDSTSPLPATRHVWTDGSVQLSHHPWHTIASFAVVAENEELLAAGQVYHWRLSSCSAELWALLVAFAIAEQPLVVHSDSLTIVIVNQFHDLQRLGHVQVDWTHTNWWVFCSRFCINGVVTANTHFKLCGVRPICLSIFLPRS